MPPKRTIQANVQVNAQQLKQLPQQAAQAAQGVQQRLAAIAQAQGPLQRRIAAQQAAAGAAALAAAQARIQQLGQHAPGRFHVAPGQRPTAVGGASGNIGAGLFRGFAQELGSATGIGIPFLSLSPAFIAASAAASTLVVSLTKGVSAVRELVQGIRDLKQQAGGSTLEVSRLAAAGRTFGVDTNDITTGVQAMRERLAEGNPAVQRLGISLTDASGKAKTAGQLFDEVRSKISRIKDPTIQASVANDVFGASYVKILPYLQQTDAVLEANTRNINKQADATQDAVQQTTVFERRLKSGENAWNQFWEGLGKNTTAALGFWAEAFDKISKEREVNDARATAIREAQIKHLSNAEIQAAGDAAAARVRAEQQAAAQIITPDAAAAPELAVERLGAVASAALQARQESDALNQSLLQIGQQRLDIAFQLQYAEKQYSNTLFEQQQQLANMAEDRAMQLAEQVAALTISLNEFNKAEFSAEVRAREQEKSFFAFRPDNALRRANEARRYERDRQQTIDRNERLNALQREQLDHQKEVADFELKNLDRQEKLTADQLALFNLTHADLDKSSEEAIMRLQAALIEQSLAGNEMAVNLRVTVDSADFTAAENARIREAVLRIVAETGADAINKLRQRRPATVNRIGGPQE